MKPLWFVEKDAFGWTINCRFMLGGRKAGISHTISPGQYASGFNRNSVIADVIQYMAHRRDNFIAEEAA